MLFHFLAFAQSAQFIPEYGLPAGLAGLILLLWRQDRKDREAERKAQEERYQRLAEDFRKIVQDNTAAIGRLSDTLDHRVMQCPLLQRPEEMLRLMAAIDQSSGTRATS